MATDVLACRTPLVQVLSLPQASVHRRDGGLAQFSEILRTLAASSTPVNPRRSS